MFKYYKNLLMLTIRSNFAETMQSIDGQDISDQNNNNTSLDELLNHYKTNDWKLDTQELHHLWKVWEELDEVFSETKDELKKLITEVKVKMITENGLSLTNWEFNSLLNDLQQVGYEVDDTDVDKSGQVYHIDGDLDWKKLTLWSEWLWARFNNNKVDVEDLVEEGDITDWLTWVIDSNNANIEAIQANLIDWLEERKKVLEWQQDISLISDIEAALEKLKLPGATIEQKDVTEIEELLKRVDLFIIDLINRNKPEEEVTEMLGDVDIENDLPSVTETRDISEAEMISQWEVFVRRIYGNESHEDAIALKELFGCSTINELVKKVIQFQDQNGLLIDWKPGADTLNKKLNRTDFFNTKDVLAYFAAERWEVAEQAEASERSEDTGTRLESSQVESVEEENRTFNMEETLEEIEDNWVWEVNTEDLGNWETITSIEWTWIVFKREVISWEDFTDPDTISYDFWNISDPALVSWAEEMWGNHLMDWVSIQFDQNKSNGNYIYFEFNDSTFGGNEDYNRRYIYVEASATKEDIQKAILDQIGKAVEERELKELLDNKVVEWVQIIDEWIVGIANEEMDFANNELAFIELESIKFKTVIESWIEKRMMSFNFDSNWDDWRADGNATYEIELTDELLALKDNPSGFVEAILSDSNIITSIKENISEAKRKDEEALNELLSWE